MKNLNYKQGFLRIWVVCTLIWYAYYIVEEFNYFDDRKAYEEALVERENNDLEEVYDSMLKRSCNFRKEDQSTCCIRDEFFDDYIKYKNERRPGKLQISNNELSYRLNFKVEKIKELPTYYSFYEENQDKVKKCDAATDSVIFWAHEKSLEFELKNLFTALLLPFVFLGVILFVLFTGKWVFKGFKKREDNEQT